jgi:hypothetical protein
MCEKVRLISTLKKARKQKQKRFKCFIFLHKYTLDTCKRTTSKRLEIKIKFRLVKCCCVHEVKQKNINFFWRDKE